jgi:hypothetical protein
MRRLSIIAAIILAAFSLPMQSQSNVVGMCWYAAGSTLLPIKAAVAGSGSAYAPVSVVVMGVNGSTYYPLTCDASGNLIVTASGGTIAAGSANAAAMYTGATTIGPFTYGIYPAQGSNPSTPANGNIAVYAFSTLGASGFTRLQWRDDAGVLGVYGRDDDVVALNSTGSTIPTGTVVYVVSGNSNNIPLIAPAEANAISTVPAIGVTAQNITNGSHGFVRRSGILTNLNTGAGGICGASACTTGQSLFVSTSTAGAFQTTRPVAPLYSDKVANALYINTSGGSILVAAAASLGNHDSGSDQTNFALPNGGVTGPATAPSGACTTAGQWVFSQDGHATVCLSSTWTTKI